LPEDFFDSLDPANPELSLAPGFFSTQVGKRYSCTLRDCLIQWDAVFAGFSTFFRTPEAAEAPKVAISAPQTAFSRGLQPSSIRKSRKVQLERNLMMILTATGNDVADVVSREVEVIGEKAGT
jgi:hypothetical protein